MLELFSRNLVTQVTRLDEGSKRQDPYHDEGDGGACYRAVLEQGTTPQVVLPRHGILHGGLVALPARARFLSPLDGAFVGYHTYHLEEKTCAACAMLRPTPECKGYKGTDARCVVKRNERVLIACEIKLW